MRAFYINTHLDEERREGMLKVCEFLKLNCIRVVPPALNSSIVRTCLATTEMNHFECSLVHAHRNILLKIAHSGERSLVFEDDARLNQGIRPEEARAELDAVGQDFVMGGWCDPSCAHAYMVSPDGATMLLEQGFHDPTRPADSMFPYFEGGKPMEAIVASGGKLLHPLPCPLGYPTDIGMFCQDRSTAHCNAYFLAIPEAAQTMADFARTRDTVFE